MKVGKKATKKLKGFIGSVQLEDMDWNESSSFIYFVISQIIY